MVTFRLALHELRPLQIVEVLIDGRVSATIVPGDTAGGLHIITRHLDTPPLIYNETDEQTNITIHAIQIFLKRKD